jgi:hypothetical protein
MRLSVAAADLKKLKMREMYKRVKLWRIYILLNRIERANVRIDEFGIFGSANLNVTAAQTLIRNGIRNSEIFIELDERIRIYTDF